MGGSQGGKGGGRKLARSETWQSGFLSRMSVDEIPRASCERLLISIKTDLDVIGFGLRLSKSSPAHLYHTGQHPHWDGKIASGTPEKGGF